MANWQDQLSQYKKETLGDSSPVDQGGNDAHELWAAAAATGTSPLQKLIFADCQTDDARTNALKETVSAEKSHCGDLYKALTARTETLADETVTATFPWRLRVVGLRGFQELLLPVFHPVYGIPYIPSSSVKGMLRAWADKALPEEEKKIRDIFGYLDGEKGATARVQILDAFPIKSCLSVDIANPQWHWNDRQQVKYNPVPHPMLSMQDVTIKIGLKRTSSGRPEDVTTGRDWLEKALLVEGLGGRVSAGYGRAQKVNEKKRTSFSPRYVTSTHPFELWSEGMHGISTQSPEFRTVSVRGVLRYWFRAFALGLYSPQQSQILENNFFGSLDMPVGDETKKLSLRLSATSEPIAGSKVPLAISGSFLLEARNEAHLRLAQCLLKLAGHLGAVGKGARRSLHMNSSRFRGGYLQLNEAQDCLNCERTEWVAFFNEIRAAFVEVAGSTDMGSPGSGSPGRPGDRTQDVLNQQAKVYLIPSPNLKHPSRIADWRREGNRHDVRGTALEFFYSSGYKGVNRQGAGNANVGGSFRPPTPSFVWIASNCLQPGSQPYQVLTIFGTNQSDRQHFAQLAAQRPSAIKVWE